MQTLKPRVVLENRYRYRRRIHQVHLPQPGTPPTRPDIYFAPCCLRNLRGVGSAQRDGEVALFNQPTSKEAGTTILRSSLAGHRSGGGSRTLFILQRTLHAVR